MLTYTIFCVLFSYVYGFGQKNYLSPIGFGNKHNQSNIFAIAKYGNVLHNVLRSGMHLVHVHNLPDVIWLTFKQKQGVQILFTTTSTGTTFHTILIFSSWFGLKEITVRPHMYIGCLYSTFRCLHQFFCDFLQCIQCPRAYQDVTRLAPKTVIFHACGNLIKNPSTVHILV